MSAIDCDTRTSLVPQMSPHSTPHAAYASAHAWRWHHNIRLFTQSQINPCTPAWVCHFRVIMCRLSCAGDSPGPCSASLVLVCPRLAIGLVAKFHTVLWLLVQTEVEAKQRHVPPGVVPVLPCTLNRPARTHSHAYVRTAVHNQEALAAAIGRKPALAAKTLPRARQLGSRAGYPPREPSCKP